MDMTRRHALGLSAIEAQRGKGAFSARPDFNTLKFKLEISGKDG